MVAVGCTDLNKKNFLKNHLNGGLQVQSLQTRMNIAKLNRVNYPFKLI